VRILVVGASGTIGSEVALALSASHEVVRAARKSGDHRVDLASQASIEELYAAVGPIDAVVCAAGEARFRPLDELTDEDFRFSLSSKLMGQIDLVRLGIPRLRDRGSFTLTSGVLAREPIRGGAAISVVNAGVEAFVRSAALEMPRGLRINAVSPPWVSETLRAMGRDPSGGMPAARVSAAYVDGVAGDANGTVIDARRFA
jgi:NAD(P)-dependent dehydrogenase (short-subunit alcohol dehydrogenase family)